MRVNCSWCGKILVFDGPDDRLSHGICMACAIKELEKAGIDPNPFFVSCLRAKQPDKILPPGTLDPDQAVK